MSMDLELVEDILKHAKLHVRSELDVVHAIIRWVMKGGHLVESYLARELTCCADEETEKNQIPYCLFFFLFQKNTIFKEVENSNGQVPLNEQGIVKLTSHIPVAKLSLADLKSIVRVCGQARFGELKNRGMKQFLEDEPRFELLTSVPHLLRVVHVCSSPIFTIQRRFNNISSQRSPYLRMIQYIKDSNRSYKWSLFLKRTVLETGANGNETRNVWDISLKVNPGKEKIVDVQFYASNGQYVFATSDKQTCPLHQISA